MPARDGGADDQPVHRPRLALVTLLALTCALFVAQRRGEPRPPSLCEAVEAALALVRTNDLALTGAGLESARAVLACPVPALHHKRMKFTCISERPGS